MTSSDGNHKLAEAIGTELVREELLGQYVQLLKDNEAEVRTAAATQVPGMLAYEYKRGCLILVFRLF
jgi:serine/threonine-protein phosphatase 2A regulatory subunit A